LLLVGVVLGLFMPNTARALWRWLHRDSDARRR